MTKIEVDLSYIDKSLTEKVAIMDINTEKNNITILTGLSKRVEDTNPWSYGGGNPMFEEMFDMMVNIGAGVYVSPSVGAAFAAFEPVDVIQKRSAEVKAIAGAMNHLCLPMGEDVVCVDPSAGIVNAVKKMGQKDLKVVYTHADFPRETIANTAQFAAQEGIRMLVANGPRFTPYTSVLGMESPPERKAALVRGTGAQGIPCYALKDMQKYDSFYYLGSMGHNCAKFERSCGYQINQVHPSSYRAIENASYDKGKVTYTLKGFPALRQFELFPRYYRYHPLQMLKYAMKVRAKGSAVSNAMVCTSKPYTDSLVMRLPPPPVRMLTADARFMAMDASFNGLTSEEGEYKESLGCVWDVPGKDTYFSRYRRLLDYAEETGKHPVTMYATYQEARGRNPEKRLWLCTSQHVDPVVVEEIPGTHYSYWLEDCPFDVFYCQFGSFYSVLSEHPVLNTTRGTVHGVLNAVVIPGPGYRVKRRSYACWPYLPKHYQNRNPFVDLQRCMTVDCGSGGTPPLRGGDGKTVTVWEVCHQCNTSCMRVFTNKDGEGKNFCAEDHSVAFVYSFNTMYLPAGFDQFARTPWCDEFVGDHPQSQELDAPEEYSVGVGESAQELWD